MTSDKPDLLHGAAPAAWRVAAQVVAGVGQVLLWVLNLIGRLFRPITGRVVAALYGRSEPPKTPPGAYAPRGMPGSGPYGRPGAQDGPAAQGVSESGPMAGAWPVPGSGAVPRPGPGPGPAPGPGPGPGIGTMPYAGPPGTPASPGGTLYTRQGAGAGEPHGAPGRPPKAPPLLRWAHRWRNFGRSWAYGPITGALLAVAALFELPLHHLDVVSLPGAFALGSTVPLMFRRESLRPAAAITLGALAASLLSGQPLLAVTAFAGLYTLFRLAQQLPRQSAGMLGVGAVATVGVVYLASGSLDDIPWLAGIVAVVAAIGLGDARRTVETAAASVDEERERNTETLTRLNAVQHEQAVLRERARIARELHDVVAHSVSMIAVQAETAPYTMRDLSPEAKKGYAEIAGAAREALDEMRRLLTVLRGDAQAQPEVTPQPRLDRLPELIDMHRGAGGDANLTVHGSARPLSTTVELSAYRIVQEALTNARRHAPGSRVRVELDYHTDRLGVRVTDEGAAAPTQVLGKPKIGGHGLVGMRERATMLGGRFNAGPRTEGGFAVEAELPVGKNRAS